jgi:hypothetical protein
MSLDPDDGPMPTSELDLELVAYRLPGAAMPLEPAVGNRVWMDATDERFAYRCLPLKVANESGWVIRSSHLVLATWDGGPAKENLQVDYLRGEPPFPAMSHFGHGILTWAVPYQFRTPPGYNLLMRGPANWPKDGATALEGLIESDWSAASATMNWKLTRPGLTVRFDVGDPIAMLVPMRRGELESFHPRVMDMADDPDQRQRHAAWSESRMAFLAELPDRFGEPPAHLWQKDYMRGREPTGEPAPEHERKRRLLPFTSSTEDG